MPPEGKPLTNRSDHIVEAVRRRFLEAAAESPDDYYPQDLEHIREDNWFVKRFVIARQRDEDESFKMLLDAMKWRKEFGLREITPEYFPKEFYISGGCFPYEKDKAGNSTIYLRVKMVKRIPELSPYLRKFLTYNLWRMDEENNGRGWVMIFDTTGAGLGNCDFDFLFYMISILKTYFPIGLEYILVLNLPWVLQQFWKLAKAWIPEERRKLVRFANQSELADLFDPEALPDYLGGACKRTYNVAPEGSPKCYDFGVNEAKLPLKRVDEIIKQFTEFLPKGYLDTC